MATQGQGGYGGGIPGYSAAGNPGTSRTAPNGQSGVGPGAGGGAGYGDSTIVGSGANGNPGAVIIQYNQTITTNTPQYKAYDETAFSVGGGWKKIKQLFIKQNGAWKAVQNALEINDQRFNRYTTPGTYFWTAPLNVSAVNVRVYGAGGGSPGGGGGAGGYSEKLQTVTPGQTYGVVVGTGGIGIQDGGQSNFAGIIIAEGGKAGAVKSAGPDAGGAGGVASGGTVLLSGQSGGEGLLLAVSNTYYYGKNGIGYDGFGSGAESATTPGGNGAVIISY